jgi:uncharacterized protein (DUF736 family)
MATIGTFKKSGEEYTGIFETLTIRANILVTPNDKKSANAPDYRVFQKNPHFNSEIGAGWKKSARDGSEYLSVSLDDPSFADKINCRLIGTGPENNYTLCWDRQRARD